MPHCHAGSKCGATRSMSSQRAVPRAARAPESMAWGTSPAMYLSYGMVSLKGRRPALTDAVAAAESFTVLSPPMGLDYFAVFDGGHLGAAAAERLRARLAAAIAARIEGELRSETPLLGGASRDVAGSWRTVVGEAFRVVDGEVVAGGDAFVGATALVALVLEKYIVVANCGGGASKAVLSHGGEHVDLSPDQRTANKEDEKQSVENASNGRVVYSSASNVVQQIAFGSSSGKPPEPDVVVAERMAQDDFLILASDGLWDAMTAASACGHVRRRLVTTPKNPRPREPRLDGSRGSPTVLAKELAEHAVRGGSQDNVSVLLVLFRELWARTARRA